MDDLRFDVGALRAASGGMHDASQDLADRARQLIAECGDLSVLGTNDTLGATAQPLYGAVLDALEETVDAITTGLSDHGDNLRSAADSYEQTEADNARSGTGMVD